MIPPTSHQRWQGLVTGKIAFSPSTLAAKILMQRIDLLVKIDPSPTTVAKCVQDLHAYFSKYELMERDDIAKLFG